MKLQTKVLMGLLVVCLQQSILCFLVCVHYANADVYKIEAVVTQQTFPSKEKWEDKVKRWGEIGVVVNATAQANAKALHQSGTSYTYPATLYIEYDPETKLISQYRIDYKVPVVNTLDTNFTPENPTINFEEEITVIYDYSNDRKYRKSKIADTENEAVINSFNGYPPETVCKLTIMLNELAFTDPTKSIQVGDEKILTYEYPEKEMRLKKNKENIIYEVESTMLDPATGETIEELVQLEWFSHVYFPKLYTHFLPQGNMIIKCTSADNISTNVEAKNLFKFDTKETAEF